MALSRRELLFGRLFGLSEPPPAAAPPPVAAPPRAVATAPDPEVPAEIAGKAARFRAEMAARKRAPSTPAAVGVIAWQGAAPARPTLLRPPGAVAEPEFLALCTRCGDCAPACPHAAVSFAGERLVGAAGTPIVVPSTAACAMCEDVPCARACPTGALRPDLPRKMGTARVQTFSCLNALGGVCATCVERCPVPSAIRVDGRRIAVDAEACTGCGVCAHVCPAPGGAIVIEPWSGRPTPGGES